MDAGHPASRRGLGAADRRAAPSHLARVVADLAPKLLLAERSTVEALRAHAPELPAAIPAERAFALDVVAPRRAVATSPDDLAMILYTSGSTGEPKGIMLTGANLCSFVDWAVSTFDVSARDRLANHAPLHFDLSTFDIFGALARHASVHLIDESAAWFPGRLRELIEAKGLTIWYSVPTALVRLQERRALAGLRSLRLMLFAGEVFPMPVLRRLMADLPGPEYVNLFGPTETNVCTYHRLPGVPASDMDTLPIGRPCENLSVRILDTERREAEAGEIGEICVEGPSVMAGYWGRPELTRATRWQGRAKSYLTGDYGYRARRRHVVLRRSPRPAGQDPRPPRRAAGARNPRSTPIPSSARPRPASCPTKGSAACWWCSRWRAARRGRAPPISAHSSPSACRPTIGRIASNSCPPCRAPPTASAIAAPSCPARKP